MDLVGLPREILANILSLECSILSRQDIKSVRATCRELAGVVTPILFYRICISPLIKDRDSFLNIAHTPDLARLVRVIVWEELNGDLQEFEQNRWEERVSNYEIPFFQDFTTNARALFWLDSLHPWYRLSPSRELGEYDTDSDETDRQQAIASSFLDEFEISIEKTLFNVHTLVSRPMHPHRQIKIPSMDYLASVSSITSFIHRNESICRFNYGFTFFLIPTLKALSDITPSSDFRSKINRLIYADEGTMKKTVLADLKDSDAAAFSNLQHLDLCITGLNVDPAELQAFSVCLGSAKNLRTLKVCQEAVLETPSVSYTLDLISLIPTLDQLVEVHFVDTNINGMFSASVPFRFIRRHARTLKRVSFTSCGIKRKDLGRLATMDSLNLERFVVVSGDDIDNGRHEHVCEEDVLNYINQASDVGQERPLPYPLGDGDAELHTHDAIFDIDAWTTGAICETRGNEWERTGYDPMDVKHLDSSMLERRDEQGNSHGIGARRVRDYATNLWVDSDGIYYNPATDQEISDPEGIQKMPEDNSWETRGLRSWNWELGLWRDGESGGLKRFAFDREALGRPAFDDEDIDKDCLHQSYPYQISSDDTKEDESEESESGVPDDLDMRPFYKREEDEHGLRVEGAPRWDWGRDEKGQVWYWQVSGPGGYETEMWRFEHGGEHAYGNDPLEFWVDWYDGPEDEVEATPYGWNLLQFVQSKNIGSKIPREDACGSLSRYEKWNDPVSRGDCGNPGLPLPVDFEVEAMDDLS